MQSFGDDTLLACINIEKKHQTLQKQTEEIQELQEENISDLGKYFKSNSMLSEFANTQNNVNKLKSSDSDTKRIEEKKTFDSVKYFEDSILFSEANSRRNLSPAFSAPKENSLPPQKKRSPHRTNNENVDTNLKEKYRLDIINSTKKCEKFSTQNFYKNKSSNTQNATSSDVIRSSAVNSAYDEENSEFVILSPPIGTQDRCKLASWGLPPNILQKYIAHGVEEMFTWQMECLSNDLVMQERKNLVYSAPTSAGKTFVAEMLLIKTVLEKKKKVIFILPFVSVVREKMYYFQDLLSDVGIKVYGFMGGSVPPGGFATTDVAVATIEKANSLVNRLMEENDLSSLGAVIIDELHLLGDPNRGYLLELLLTKLKYMTIHNNDVNIQLIGMSATLPNLTLLAKWLNAELYKTEFRPIPLNEYCKIGANIYDNKLNLVRKLIELQELGIDVDNILQLCIETISAGHSVLIFCPTKKWCEKLAEQIATAFFKLGCGDTKFGEMLKKEIDSTLIQETLEQLKRSPSGLDNILKNTISFGTAFHHAGLTMDERDIIEGSFRTGSLRVLIATSTLSSGVNLPARRVIIRSPLFGGSPLNTLTYKQMIGRAGRMGKDSAGESILICKPNERNAAASLLSAALDPIESCLNDFSLLIRALLEAVASEVLYTYKDLELYINCTLLSLNEQSDVQIFSNEAIKFLLDNEFLLLQTTERESRWVATPLGKACLAASIPPREGLFLFEELQKARRCFVLDTELHVIYLVTPLSSGCQIGTVDWMTFHELWNTMSESERRVGKLVGVEERFVLSAIRGIVKSGKSLNIHRRFYSALALHDLVKEVPLHVVCKKYGCCRGVLQTLQQSAATYAGMVTQFCKQLGWDCMELLVSQFQTRLQFGVCRELLDLLQLPMLNGLRARSLYKQGIETVADLAIANELNVERALYNALPFESEKEYEGEYAFDVEKRNKMRTVFVTGRDGLTPQQAAILLIQEARSLIQNELGLEQMPWEQNEQSLQINTCAKNVEDTSDIKEKIQSLDIKNSPKMRTSIIENSLHVKSPVSNENQKENNPKFEICKESETDKNKVIESNNQHLNEANLLPKISEVNRNSSFLDLSSLDIIANDEQLDIPKEKIIFSATDSSTKIKRSSKNSEQLKFITNDIPSKKLKISSINEKNNDENLINKDKNISIISKDIKPSYSRSPSLFDDSLNLDTQMCDILEQNVMDITHLTGLDSKAFVSELDATNALQKESTSPNTDNVQLCDKNNAKSIGTANLQSKNSILSWGDDSWINCEGLLKQIAQDQNVIQSKKDISNSKIKNIVNTNISLALKNMKTCTQSNKESTIKTDIKKHAAVKEKAPRKPKLSRETEIDSPVANIIVFRKERKTSADSNKSDSEDFIVDSQHFESPFSSNKSRTKTTLEKIRKLRSQKLADEDTLTKMNNCLINSPIKEISNDKVDDKIKEEEQEMTSKLKEIPTQNPSASIDNVIYNSEDETANNLTRSTLKKQYETQSNNLDKNVKLKTENVLPDNKKNLLNETIEWNTLNIVKVANNRATFNLFKREILKKRNIALALHCDLYIDNTTNIGSKICASNAEGKRKSRKSGNYSHGNKEIRGVAISWESNIAYYISFSNSQESKVSGKEQMALLKDLLYDTTLYMKCFATKDIYKLLYQCCGITAKCRFLDPIIGHWLYTNDFERNFNEMVLEYFQQGNVIMKRIKSCYYAGPGMDARNSLPGEFRSAAEAVLTWHMMDNIMNKLEELNPALLYTFREVEMRIMTTLACMELSGIGVNLKSLQELSSVVSNEMQSLETKAYDLAGRKFNFSSSKEVGQVLGLYKDKKVSTSKTVLEKCDNPISTLVISWRKLNATKTKMIYPLLNLAQGDSRVRGNCITCTVTGRVSMHEPNLQNVPKDFSFADNNLVVSVRMAFVPVLGNIMLSADYCQLELRLLTHFSQDSILCKIMKQSGDIFKNIAAKWNNVAEEQVTNEMRQRTKQLCYGMIYGMGVKSLAENLCISEPEAQEFLESFMSAYPGIYKWLNDILEEAHHDGYVTTLLGRRREFPDLSSTKSSVRAQAERQSVNTKVQGSAADIVKKAMISIEDKIRCYFPDSAIIFPEVHASRKLRSNLQQRGGYLVLQLHDELLYEVNLADLKKFAAIIRESMENVCQLTVPLPVKIRVGPAWGDLNDYQF
ncbi:PREDICTED: DNA polymerase theta [Acromyrmex echinatior]|uniref:Helicase POLQ-like protein n=1 Tax=Acromyrmex echinatior TaxID=103372 RepID=F4X125_ACREC|nr:PREDICTED: DNA polymerase theta [Acromyrmex echinatior]EGI59836.1 Helicase POLQ-like protein [Acromyrmex echinatior]